MNFGLFFDIGLCILLLGVALAAIAARSLFASLSLFIVLGLLVAIAWVRLGAVDVALAEAAIGAGLTGMLLLSAAARLDGEAQNRLPVQPLPILVCLIVAVAVGWSVVELDTPAEGLAPLVEQNLGSTGVKNAITAVLLNFRGWDTMLETVVLLIALIAVWSLGDDAHWPGRPGLIQNVRPDGILVTFGRFLPPLGFLVGAYLVWVGSSAPGGAFQGGTVIAAMWVLTMMAGLYHPLPVSSRGLRWALAGGPIFFLVIGLTGVFQGAFLFLPPGEAKEMIRLIEIALAMSIALTLGLLLVGPPRRPA